MNLAVAPPRRVSDPGAPRLRVDVAVLVAIAGAIAVGAAVFGSGRWPDVTVLGAAFVIAELLEMRLVDGTALPLSYAVLLPVAAAASPAEAVLMVGTATAAVALTRHDRSRGERVRGVAERLASAWAVVGAVQMVDSFAPAGESSTVLATLLAGGGVLLATELAFRMVRGDGSFAAAKGYAAFFAVGASGVLMGAAYTGVDGRGAMGAWALVMFAVPALAARWAFGRLHAIRRTYDQTIRVLSVVPEMTGRVRPGHSQRVRDLVLRVGRTLGLPSASLGDLERAALLHSLGHVTLDEPEPGRPYRPSLSAEVAGATVGVLQDGDSLSRPTALLASLAGDTVDLTDDGRLAGEVLKAVASFEDLTGGDPALKRPALQYVASARGGIADRRVVAALGRVVFSESLHRSASARMHAER